MIQRYDTRDIYESEDGTMVMYKDHVELISAYRRETKALNARIEDLEEIIDKEWIRVVHNT